MIKYIKLNKTVMKKDFEFEFNKGSYLIKGPNGAGKTTLLSSLHPFDSFYAKNISVRDILEPGGIKEIVITKGKKDYLVRIKKRKSSDEFVIKEGSKQILKTASVNIFNNTIKQIFNPDYLEFTQLHASLPNIAGIRNSDFKNILLKLAQGDLYDKIRSDLKAKASELKSEISKFESFFSGIKQTIKTDEYTKPEVIEKELKQLKDNLNHISAQIKKLREQKEERNTLMVELSRLNGIKSNKEDEIKRLQEKKSLMESQGLETDTYEENKTKLATLEEKQQILMESKMNELTMIDQNLVKIDQKVMLITTELNHRKKLLGLPCSADIRQQCPLVKTTNSEFKDLSDEELEQKLNRLAQAKENFLIEKQNTAELYDSKLQKMSLTIQSLRNVIKQQQEALAYDKYIKENIANIDKYYEEIKDLDSQIEFLTKQMEAINFSQDELSFLEEGYEKQLKEVSDLEHKLAEAKRIEEVIADMKIKEKELEALMSQIQDVEIVNKIFSINEFPAVELGRVMATIIEKTNELFEKYNPKFKFFMNLKNDARLSIDMSVLKDGVEELKPALLSSGEQVWINKFVRLSFVLAARQVAPYIDFIVCDEGEGSLDHGIRENFLRAHTDLVNEYNFNQLFVVSHDLRASALFQNVIELT